MPWWRAPSSRERCSSLRWPSSRTQARLPKPLLKAQGSIEPAAAAGCRVWQVVSKCAAPQMEETRRDERILAGAASQSSCSTHLSTSYDQGAKKSETHPVHATHFRGETTCGFGP